MSRPVLNLQAVFGTIRDGAVFLAQPWNSFFQQFTQPPEAISTVIVAASPFSYQPNSFGQVFVRSGTVSNISLIRGNVIINMTGALSVLVSIGDIVKVTYSVKPTMQFAELF